MRPLPITAWPAADQAAWTASTMVRRWTAQEGRFDRRIAAAWSRLLTSTAGEPISAEAVDAHRDGLLLAHRRSLTALTYLEELGYALRILRPRSDWSALIEHNRTLRKELTYHARHRPSRSPATPRNGRVVPLEAWPAVDLARWRQAMALAAKPGRSDRYRRGGSGDAAPSSAMASCACWSEAYRRRIARGYGLWLGWCRRTGWPEHEVTSDAVADFVESFASRGSADLSLASYTYELWRALIIVRPDEDWSWLRQDVEALKAGAVPRRDKRSRCVPLAEVLRLGQQLMRDAAHGPATRRHATMFRDGLMISLAAWRPKRVSNLTSMRLGREVVLAADGTPLRLAWETTKNGDPSDTTWPTTLRPAWHAWLTKWRPVFAGAAGSDAVWLQKSGRALSACGVSTAFAYRTQAAFGMALRPHMWRTIHANSVLIKEPALAPAVSTMLDHRHPRSLEVYALDARTRGAAATLDRSLTPLMLRMGPARHRGDQDLADRPARS